ncbi:pentapeptide repeat-containing protein [Catellatospora tritici]|uniref:pentapeptide repeat-containing protein n=1 Tax=Catellatospora tritici TaxID=2851566 RepID=UPI001C2DAF04|nr:pentapeptide repeat-containing protein [Catellatospora tritici]MBV1851870.1 pentapeptide repeat-containing protein [Catellatospora tritici]
MAAELLHGTDYVRAMVGLHEMARLADEWPDGRQACVDEICAHLRRPARSWSAADRVLRRQAVALLAARLRPQAKISWQGCDLDLQGAVLDGCSFVGARFSAGRVDFGGAEFSGDPVYFTDVEFAGAVVSFVGARFASRVEFTGAVFGGGVVDFGGAKFADGTTDLSFTIFRRGIVEFTGAVFGGARVDFFGARFCGAQVVFQQARFAAGAVRFTGVRLSGGRLSFRGMSLTACAVDFANASHTGGVVVFSPGPISDALPSAGRSWRRRSRAQAGTTKSQNAP